MRQDLPPENWERSYRALLCECGIRPDARVADLACGTGAVTLPLARAGYRMLGLDRSREMLNRARDKAASMGLTLPWVCQDLRELDITGEWDACLCACDGVNYLTDPAEARLFFSRVFQTLRPGGLFAFDISSAYKLAAMDAQTYTLDEDDAAYIWTNRMDSRTRVLTMELTLFIRRGEVFVRAEETHAQRAHEKGEILTWLREAGFSGVSAREAFTDAPPKRDSPRLLFRAVKPKKTKKKKENG